VGVQRLKLCPRLYSAGNCSARSHSAGKGDFMPKQRAPIYLTDPCSLRSHAGVCSGGVADSVVFSATACPAYVVLGTALVVTIRAAEETRGLLTDGRGQSGPPRLQKIF
jgi:hypothetical protein